MASRIGMVSGYRKDGILGWPPGIAA